MDNKLLETLVNSNPGIEHKEYMIKCLTWLEEIIPEDSRENLYRNVKTLKTDLNININLLNASNNIVGYMNSAGYDVINNSLTMNEKSLKELWSMAKRNINPEDFYWRYYLQILLHELAHMASSRYNKETEISLCGFDKYPMDNVSEKNRGLTEGFTEIISMWIVSGTREMFSGYYIEICLIKQLMQIIGSEVFLKAYFSNLGTLPLQEELNNIINNPVLASDMFKNIEINYNIRDISEQQNVLGRIQLSLLDYLEVKIKSLVVDKKYEEVDNILSNYEDAIITFDKLQLIGEDYSKFIGLDDSIMKFNEIKNNYNKYLCKYNKKLVKNF